MNKETKEEPEFECNTHSKVSLNMTEALNISRYRLIDQRQHNFLCFRDNVNGARMIIHATNLASNDSLIRQFDSWDACRIGIIAGLACNEPPPPEYIE